MNKIMFDILNYINGGNSWDVKLFSRTFYKPYSVMEQEYQSLEYEGYLCDGRLTDMALGYLQEHEIKNALILSAGVSSRFVPICFEKPKALLRVKGEVLIERQIRQLQEIGIKDISIVVGYMKEQFAYLIDKFGVKLIETDTFQIRNNYASVYAARECLNSTIVTSADLYFAENIFQKYAYDAFYCTIYKEGATDERGITTDSYDKIVNTQYGVADTWVTLGYAYFNPRFSANIISIIKRVYDDKKSYNKFWADFQDENLDELYMYAKRCPGDVIFEFDSLEDLRAFDDTYEKTSDSVILSELSKMIGAKDNELTDFRPIVKEDLGRGCTFRVGTKKYIARIFPDLSIKSVKRFDDKIQELVNLSDSFKTYYDKTLPLCAAENVMSDFSKMPLSMGFQERYIVGNSYSFTEKDNFIGSTYLLPFYNMISDQCRQLFDAKYTDSRTLTGMNCLMMVLTSLSEPGDSILILPEGAGGHASVRPIAKRLGLIVDDVPFDYEKMDLDYERLNKLTETEATKFVLLAPSDIIRPFDIEKMDTNNTVLLYDVSQLLGLIAAGIVDNPLKHHHNIVMFGGTHKTFPGPACGLIMTNHDELHEKMETRINPIYIRHTQMHQKVSLLFSLVEFDSFGEAYQERIVELSNELGLQLQKRGFDVPRFNGRFSNTHQVFIRTSESEMNRIYNEAVRLGITLNKKKKELFGGFGIRLGTQEIARYGWTVETMSLIAEIIYEISKENYNTELVNNMLDQLPEKKIQYCFDNSVNRFF